MATAVSSPFQWVSAAGRFVRHLVLPNPLRIEGLRLWRHPLQRDPLRALWRGGIYEKKELTRLRAFLRPGMGFADVGGHIGLFTFAMAREVAPQGRVYTFEANPLCIPLLRRNARSNQGGHQVEIVHAAVSDQGGEADFSLAFQMGASSLYRTPRITYARSCKVRTIKLDDYFAEAGWPRVDAMKLDIEGGEPAALRGMKELVSRNAGFRLLVECNPRALHAAGESIKSFLDALEGIGVHRVTVCGEESTHALRGNGLESRLDRIKNHLNLWCETPGTPA